MATHSTRLSKDVILKALEEHNFNVAETSRALGYVRPNHLWKRINKIPELKAKVDQYEQPGKVETFSHVSEEKYLAAIRQARGNRAIIAKLLGVNLSGVYERINKNPKLREACRVASEELKDIAETKLFELVEAGDFQAIKFYLSTQGRDRGYGEKLEVSGSVNVEHRWDLTRLNMDELLILENIARRALPKGEEDVVDGAFTEIPANPGSDRS